MENSINELKTQAEKIYVDALTGIKSRRYFEENLSRIMKSLSRSGGSLSVMMIDIDRFKEFNDTYGHGEGDVCLQIVAKSLEKSITRVDDFVARYGGEEFVVVLPNTDGSGACMIAEKILENVWSHKLPNEKSDVAEYVTVSVGVASGIVSHTQSGGEYVKKADDMLYVSKQSGRNRYTFSEF